MTHQLGELGAEHFEALVGQTFEIDGVTVTLREVARRARPHAKFREPFSLVFDAPAGCAVRSEVLRVTHPAVGRHDLLVTQVADVERGSALQICFG